MLTSVKHSNLLVQFLSYEENEVLWKRTLVSLAQTFQLRIFNELVNMANSTSFKIDCNSCNVCAYVKIVFRNKPDLIVSRSLLL